MDFTLPALPYAKNALEPVISSRTLDHHYDKHHQAYLTKLEAALSDGDKSKSLEDIIVESYQQKNAGVFNNAAQVWNHTFYWNSMTPDPEGITNEKLQQLIDTGFGGTDGLLEQFKATAVGQFGSGWAWLVYDAGSDSLSLTGTSNAETPITGDLTPLVTVDVWEHAYYLDHQQDRPGYVEAVLGKLLNWRFAQENFEKAAG